MNTFSDTQHPLAQALGNLIQQRLLLLNPGWLDPVTCQDWIRQLAHRPGEPALSEDHGYQGAEPLRMVKILDPGPLEQIFMQRLQAFAPQLAAHFRQQPSRHERPQFLRYGAGDYFRMHRDLIDAPVYRDRRISVIVFLNDHECSPSWRDGRLSLFVRNPQAPDQLMGVPIPPAQGLLVAFDSRLPHEISEITAGERYTVVTWLAQ